MGGICGADEKKNSRENSLSKMRRDRCSRGTLAVPQVVTAVSEFRFYLHQIKRKLSSSP